MTQLYMRVGNPYRTCPKNLQGRLPPSSGGQGSPPNRLPDELYRISSQRVNNRITINQLAERHPYLRSRLEQERTVTSLPGLDGDVLELPYIFCDPLWRKPLWCPLVKYILATPLVFYMRGGNACITPKMVGKAPSLSSNAVMRALATQSARKIWPGGRLTRPTLADRRTVRAVTLPLWFIKLGLFGVLLIHKLHGKEDGLNLRYFAQLQTAETFLDPQPSKEALGYQTSSLDEAFRETVEACKP